MSLQRVEFPTECLEEGALDSPRQSSWQLLVDLVDCMLPVESEKTALEMWVLIDLAYRVHDDRAEWYRTALD